MAEAVISYTLVRQPLTPHLALPSLLLLLLSGCVHLRVSGQTYNDAMHLFNAKLDPARYNPNIRPLVNQSQPIRIGIRFTLISVIRVSSVSQTLTVNGLLEFQWKDEVIQWKGSQHEYDDLHQLSPLPEQVWRPTVLLVNTVGDRDPFKDDRSPVRIKPDGNISWIPGSVFETSCSLKLNKFPFDKQKCIIELCSMNYFTSQLYFQLEDNNLIMDFLVPNQEWKLNTVIMTTKDGGGGINNVSCLQIKFHLARRPKFMVLIVILPITILSLLNILVMAIPVESGEKISYGISVLLSLTVFLTSATSLLPASSDDIPAIISYLFYMMMLAVVSVAFSILSGYRYFKEQSTSNADTSQATVGATPTHKDTLDTGSVDDVIMEAHKNERVAFNFDPDGLAVQTMPARRLRLDGCVAKPPRERVEMIEFAVIVLLWLTGTITYFVFVVSP